VEDNPLLAGKEIWGEFSMKKSDDFIRHLDQKEKTRERNCGCTGVAL